MLGEVASRANVTARTGMVAMLKRNRRDLTEPAVRLGLFPGGQQRGRLSVAQALTRFGVVVFTRIQGKMVDHADATKRASKIVLLLGRGVKTISKTCVDHVLTYRSRRRVFPLTCRRRRSRKGRGACCKAPMNQGVLAPPSNSPFSIKMVVIVSAVRTRKSRCFDALCLRFGR